MAADRAQHVAEVMRPGAGAGPARGHRPLHRLLARLPGLRPRAAGRRGGRLSAWATDGLWPDLVVLLDVPARACGRPARRRAARPHGGGRRRLPPPGGRRLPRPGRRRPGRWVVVDGTARHEEVEAIGLAPPSPPPARPGRRLPAGLTRAARRMAVAGSPSVEDGR